MLKAFIIPTTRHFCSLPVRVLNGFSKTYRCVLLRHGESEWNNQNRFTGWTDVRLTETGKQEAASAGLILKERGFQFDIVFVSVLTRTIQTYNIVADKLNCAYLPVVASWRLNERHYGDLQGFNKADLELQRGKELVRGWRKNYNSAPPAIKEDDIRHPIHDPRYKNLPKDLLPASESLKDTFIRVLPFWQDQIATAILSGKRPLVVAHGNSIKGLVKYFDNLTDEELIKLNIPTGIPLVYEFDEDLKKIKSYYLASEAEMSLKMEKIALQDKVR